MDLVGPMSSSWNAFAEVVGSASGALLGLLFVAVSINRERMIRFPGLLAAAGRTLVIFLLALLLALEVATPGQSTRILGVEVLGTGFLEGVGLILLGRWKRRASSPSHSRLSRLLDSTSPTLGITAFVIVAGVELAANQARGLYWLVPAIALAWIGGTLNAWLFLFQSDEEDRAGSSRDE